MRKSILALILSLSLLTVTSAFISPFPNVTNNEISLNFPESATFRATIVAPQSTSQTTPTFVPTIVPFGGVALILQATPTPVPTSSFSVQPTTTPVRGRPPLSLTLILLGLCCFFLLFIGILILGFVVRRQSIKELKKDQESNSR